MQKLFYFTGVAYALKDCDAQLIFTSRSLLSKVHRALDTCPSIKYVVYYKEPHRRVDDDGLASHEQKAAFKAAKLTLISFDELLLADDEKGWSTCCIKSTTFV